MLRLLGIVSIFLVSVNPIWADAKEYFKDTEKDFGTTARGPVLTHYFQIQNTTQSDVTIGTPRIQCGCVSVNVLKSQLKPGEKTYIVASMDTKKIPPTQFNRNKSVAVYVPFLSPRLEEVTIKVSTTARDDLMMSTTDGLGFGTIRKGEGGTAQVTLTLFNNANWAIESVESTGVHVKAEVKKLAGNFGQVAYEINATVSKECPVGNWACDVWVKTNAPGLEKLRIPVTVNVVPVISSNPAQVDFNQQAVGGTVAPRQILLSGTEPFELLTIEGTTEQLNASAVTTGSRAVHIVKVEFTPKTAGDFKQELRFNTDNKNEKTVVIPVQATIVK